MESITNDAPKEKENILKKLWTFRKYFNIEPFMFFYFMPSYFNLVASQNFPLEKACRVNHNYSAIVCSTILDKDELGINCDSLEEELMENIQVGSGVLWNVTNLSLNFNYTVCKAEHDAQILGAEVSGNRQPIAAIFSLIVILFAGAWSDRHNKCKPCMIFPLIGEGLAAVVMFISAVYFDTIPMEVGAYVDAIVPAMFGGFNLVLTAVFSFMAAATPEPDRVFRFGIFSLFMSVAPLIGTPFSGFFFKKLGYVYSFAISCIFQMIAILYVLFFIDEVNSTPNGDKPLEEDSKSAELHENKKLIPPVEEPISTDLNSKEKKSCLADFFDPTLATECLKLPLEKRQNYEQPLLILVILGYFLISAPASAEEEYWFKYVIKKLSWNGSQYSFYITFSSATGIFGTFIGTSILSKALKLPDPIIGIVGALSVAISRAIFAFARNSITFYAGCLVEMFNSLRVIATRSIGSSIVAEDELTRMFAIFSVSATIADFIFPKLYSYVYVQWLETFPGMIFLFGELFFISNIVVFIICYVLLKRRSKTMKAIEDGVGKDKTEENGNSTNEITVL